ncbi:tape measure protein [Leuconostoc pseudomesenteroides]|uniref:tape measure protein n=1 Tax=Leuconostoc pseudomesenteroides TaxID=33968 RepID=UPI0039E8C5B9
MAKQIVNEMATNLTLDSKSAAAAIKQLTQEVKSASAESKIMENQYKASGDTLNASKAKYEGLQTTIEKQKAKVDDLKQALENNNTTTKKGQELQTYLTNELAKAERQYASYNGQLAKAEQAYKYQESGLAKLNDEVKHGNDLTDARVQKLEAEGNKEEAQKVKLDNLKSSNEKYNQMLTIQKNELNKLSESGDKNSDAYKRQQLRVEQMGVKVAETTRDIKRFNETDIKPETRGLNHVKEQLSSLNQSLEGTRSRFKAIFLGNLAANGVTSALESMKDKFTDLIREGAEYNKEQQVMSATWDTLTGDAKKGQAMVDSVNSISTAFGQSSDLTNELEQQFYHVFNQQGPTDTLTKSVLTMADTIGMSADETQRLGLNFTHMMTSSKLQLGDFNMITDQLPMYGEKLLEFERNQQKNQKLTMSQLRDQMSAGKISAEDAEKVMNELGEKYSKASENMMSTTAGMERVISARGTALAGALTKPIMEAKNPLFGAVSKWVSDKNTENEFTKVGDSVSKAFSTITEAFGKQFKSSTFTDGADNFMKSLSTNIEKFGDYIAKHAGDITNFFKMTKELGGAGFGIMGSTLKVALPLLEQLGKFATAHPTAFKVLAGSILGFNFALKGTLSALRDFDRLKLGIGTLSDLKGAVTKTGNAFKTAFTFLKGNPFILAVTAIGTMSVALYELYKHNEKFRNFINGIIASVQQFIKGLNFAPIEQALKIFFNTVSEVLSNISKAVGKTFKPFIKMFGSLFSGLDTEVKPIFKSVGDAFGSMMDHFDSSGKKIGFIQKLSDLFDGLTLWISNNKGLFIGFAKIITDVLGGAFVGIGASIRGLVEFSLPLIKPAVNIVISLITGLASVVKNSTKTIWNTIKLFFDVLTLNWKNVGKDIKGIVSGISGTIAAVFKTMSSVVGNIFHALVKEIDKVLWSIGTSSKPLENFGKATVKIFKGVLNFFKRDWKELLLLLVNPFAGAFALIYKHNDKFRKAVNQLVKDVVNFVKGMGESISSIVSGIVKWWQDKWNGVSNFFTGIWKAITKTGSNAINGISSTISDVLGGIGSTWRSVWGGLSSFFGGIWKDIKGFAQDGINGVLSVINAGVDGIDSVWKFFTGHETSIRHLKPVKFEQGGIVQQRLAMVNDGAGEHWKELIQLPNGEMKMSQQRNAVMALPVGTRVYNGKETKAIMSMAGIEKYANGGIVGSAIDWTKGALSDVGSWIGDKMDAIASFLKSPLSAVKSLISKATSGIVSGMGNFGQLATGTWDKLSNSVAEWFTKGLKKVQDEDGGSGKGAPSGSGVTRWTEQVKEALKANNLSTSSDMVNKVLRQIQTESGGNEKAVQGGYTDVNTLSGDLAKGLMQTISATFNAYAFPGHKNIFNGYDNLLAALAYAKNRYGSNLSYLGQGHGYANGGLITKNQMIEVGEGDKSEMIIPLSGIKSSRGFELLGKTAVAMAARDNIANSPNDTQSSNVLSDKLDSVISLLSQLVSGQSDPTPAYVVASQAQTELNKLKTTNSRVSILAKG